MLKTNIIQTNKHPLKHFIAYCSAVVFLIALYSCSEKKGNKKETDYKTFVINEVMASNQTGLLSKDGNIYDWIEIKNVSTEDASLEGYSLTLEKFDKKENGNKKVSWTFPEINVKAGGFVIVFASKNNKNIT